MGKVDRLRNRLKPFAALFWALGIGLANTWPCPRQPGITPQPYTKACPYFVIDGSILNDDTLPPPPLLSYLGMLFIYAQNCKTGPQFCAVENNMNSTV